MTIYVDPRINNSNELEQSLARLTRVPITLCARADHRACARQLAWRTRQVATAIAQLRVSSTVHTLAVSHFRVTYDFEVTRQMRM